MDVWSAIQVIEDPRYKEILIESLLTYQQQLSLTNSTLSSKIKIKDIDTIIDIIEDYSLKQELV